MVIYKTTNLVNGKIYIGKDSKNDPKYYGSGLVLNQAIKKYGIENFQKEILEYCDSKENLNNREKYWIKFYNSTDRAIGYNLTDGGDGGDLIKYLDNKEEINKKRSNSIKEYYVKNPEAKKKRSENIKKRWEEEGRKEKMSKKMRGREINWKGKISKKVKEYYKNNKKVVTKETRKKISEASVGNVDIEVSKEDKRKIIELYKAGKGPYLIESFFKNKVSRYLIRRTLKEEGIYINWAKGFPTLKEATTKVYKILLNGRIYRVSKLNVFCKEFSQNRNKVRRGTDPNCKIILRYRLNLKLTKKEYSVRSKQNNISDWINGIAKDNIYVVR